ncbi:MAG: hypothetical protein IKR68_07055 [Lachnospiraceae bacterium]|nr:hypothetical protein [Lachnospiraceae bacterium]
MVLGIDINDSESRIAYFRQGMEQPESVSQVMGSETFTIPTMLARINGSETWYFGDEARRMAGRTDVQTVTGLIEKALRSEIVIVFGKEYPALELLVKYVIKLLSLTSIMEPWQGAERICFSMGELGDKSVNLLKKLAQSLDYPSEQVEYISRSESFFEFMMHQKEELWNHDVVLLDCTGEGVIARRLNVNRKTKPAVCKVVVQSASLAEPLDDEELRKFCESQVEGRIVTSVYIAGDRISKETTPGTLKYLCMKRRVFYAHQIYSKGACQTAWDRQNGIDRRRSYLYLGKDKLKSNVGLRVSSVNEEVYVPLIDAGINWYDVRVREEIYLGRERELRLLLTPLTGRNEHYAIMRLSEIPQRPAHTTRVRINIVMESEDHLDVTVEDLGFGEIFPASGAVINEKISVSV